MRHLFISDPIQTFKAWKDTSYFLMLAAEKKGHAVYQTVAEDLFFDREVFALANQLKANDYQENQNINETIQILNTSKVKLNEFDYIWIRKDPPFHEAYLYLTLLLGHVSGATIINNPIALRDWNEKLAILPYLEYCPKSFVCSSPIIAYDYLQQTQARAVFKPLDGFGGRGIEFFQANQTSLQKDLEQYFSEHGPSIMIQEYIKEAKDGDKRVLIWNGKVLGAILRKHGDESELNNLDAGGSAYPAKITAKEQEAIDAILPDLIRKNLYFVGLDFIGEKLTEINVTSPTGLQELCRFEKRDFHLEIMQSLP